METLQQYLVGQYEESYGDVTELIHAREYNSGGSNGSCWAATVEHCVAQLDERNHAGVTHIEIIEEGNDQDGKYFERVLLTVYRDAMGQFNFDQWKLKGV